MPPLASPAARPMVMMPRPANDEAASNAAIDSQLSHFAAANAGNPGVETALDAAATEVRANPEAYINADGTVNPQAMRELLGEKFGQADVIVMPRVAMDYATGNGGISPPATLSDLGDGDIMALAFIVMMEAAKAQSDDLKSVMAGVKAINQQKQGLRDTLNQLDALKADCVAHPENCQPMGIDPRVLQARRPGQLSVQDIDNAKETVQNKLDSMSEMGETESLRLQMAMDRLSKLMSTLSNVLKKSSETSDEIIQNIK